MPPTGRRTEAQPSLAPIPEQGNATRTDFRVVVRTRPALSHEIPVANSISVHGNVLTLRQDDEFGPGPAYSFQFDHVFTERDGQEPVYEIAAHPAVQSLLSGFNASIIAYGQTGSGKTFTMEGRAQRERGIADAGVIPRAVWHIFDSIEQRRPTWCSAARRCVRQLPRPSTT